jgi:XTP/dITP diphosphohydrolase
VPKLLLATGNAGKVRELRALLAESGWDLITPADAGIDLEVDEAGGSYFENARIKALAFARAAGLPAVADDSGLEVDGLGGEPGPLHHRLGWDGSSHEERIALILDRLAGLPEAKRTCRYRAVLVVAFPDGRTIESEGTCEGVITGGESGSNGFGYDPIFHVPALGRTMAELSPEEKNRISHRAAAARAILPRLRAAALAAGGSAL